MNDFDFEKFKANVKNNLQKQIQADTLTAQFQGLGITSTDEQADYLNALIGLVAAGATPEQISDTAKEFSSGITQRQPTKAGQLSGEHLGKTTTVNTGEVTLTGQLQHVAHDADFEDINEMGGRRVKTALTNRVATLIIGGITLDDVPAFAPVEVQEEK